MDRARRRILVIASSCFSHRWLLRERRDACAARALLGINGDVVEGRAVGRALLFGRNGSCISSSPLFELYLGWERVGELNGLHDLVIPEPELAL